MPALRLFLAIDIPLREKESITTIQNQFKNLGHKISLVRSNNIHLALKFLGDTPLGQFADSSVAYHCLKFYRWSLI